MNTSNEEATIAGVNIGKIIFNQIRKRLAPKLVAASSRDGSKSLIAADAVVRLNFKGKTLMDILIMVPWALPGTVVAVNLIAAFSEPTAFSFNQVLIGTFWILPLAYFVRQLPLVFRSTSASLVQMDKSIEEAARSLGANWWYSFRKIILPITMSGILAGTLLAFVQGLGEFVASILIYSVSTMPMSVAIFQKMYAFQFGTACAYGVLQIVLIIIVLAVSRKLEGKLVNSPV